MAVAGEDPRAPAEHSARPIVARERRGMSNWMIAVGILIAALILFLILDGRRRQLSAPVTNPRFADTGVRAPAAPLYIPPEPVPTPTPLPVVVAPPPPPPPPAPPPQPRIVYVQPPQPQIVAPPPPPPRTSNTPVLVIDTTVPEGGAAGGATVATDAAGNPTGATAGAGSAVAATGGRARASVLRNRATTVPEGTLIPAVLETALDSTRPGPARALVTRDVRGFDGSKVLIPRGSRLIGEYKADLQPGQNRALVVWTRLVRPDGATIAIGSPAADPLGRVGIKGSVNSHFLERFASAILNSTLNIGVGLASRLGSGSSVAVLALPGTLGGAATPLNGPDQVQRSLRVKQGVSISVFVARDLDFTSVETKR